MPQRPRRRGRATMSDTEWGMDHAVAPGVGCTGDPRANMDHIFPSIKGLAAQGCDAALRALPAHEKHAVREWALRLLEATMPGVPEDETIAAFNAAGRLVAYAALTIAYTALLEKGRALGIDTFVHHMAIHLYEVEYRGQQSEEYPPRRAEGHDTTAAALPLWIVPMNPLAPRAGKENVAEHVGLFEEIRGA